MILEKELFLIVIVSVYMYIYIYDLRERERVFVRVCVCLVRGLGWFGSFGGSYLMIVGVSFYYFCSEL